MWGTLQLGCVASSQLSTGHLTDDHASDLGSLEQVVPEPGPSFAFVHVIVDRRNFSFFLISKNHTNLPEQEVH